MLENPPLSTSGQLAVMKFNAGQQEIVQIAAILIRRSVISISHIQQERARSP